MPPFFFEEFIVGNFDFCETCHIIIHSHVILIKPISTAAPFPRCGGLAELVIKPLFESLQGFKSPMERIFI